MRQVAKKGLKCKGGTTTTTEAALTEVLRTRGGRVRVAPFVANEGLVVDGFGAGDFEACRSES